MSKTMTNFEVVGSRTPMLKNNGRSSVSPKPNRQSIEIKDNADKSHYDDAASHLSKMLNSIRKTKGKALETGSKFDRFSAFNG